MRRPLAALLLAVLVAGCSAGDADDADGGDPAAAPSTAASDVDTVLEPCPDQPDVPTSGDRTLPALRFDCLGGGELDLGRAPGRPTVVNLWASWCTPCREELPALQEFAAAAAGEVQVVGVVSKDGVPQAGALAEDAGIRFPNAFDGEGRLMAELSLLGLPATYLVDADGALVHTEIRPLTSVDELEALVAEHLGVRL